jgi:hypothetical protein
MVGVVRFVDAFRLIYEAGPFIGIFPNGRPCNRLPGVVSEPIQGNCMLTFDLGDRVRNI